MTMTAGDAVIDLTKTRVRVERDQNPLDAMTHDERRRLLVRVLCELVAYGEMEPVAG
jgi:hypothetical protein